MHSLENIEEHQNLDLICLETAKIIGGTVTPERVKSVIEASNSGLHIAHGVKENKDYESVRQTGIMPRTPEGGYASFWTSGARIFMGDDPTSKFATYDTTFFHYSHSYDPDRQHFYMTLALTNPAALPPLESAKISQNEYLSINAPLPREKIFLLRVEINKGPTTFDERTYDQIAEQKMFEILEEALLNGYKLGDEKVLKITLGEEMQAAA